MGCGCQQRGEHCPLASRLDEEHNKGDHAEERTRHSEAAGVDTELREQAGEAPCCRRGVRRRHAVRRLPTGNSGAPQPATCEDHRECDERERRSQRRNREDGPHRIDAHPGDRYDHHEKREGSGCRRGGTGTACAGLQWGAPLEDVRGHKTRDRNKRQRGERPHTKPETLVAGSEEPSDRLETCVKLPAEGKRRQHQEELPEHFGDFGAARGER
ncbi:hypothetical protein ACFPRL_31625 [Pseudoclavibacter helvolus]